MTHLNPMLSHQAFTQEKRLDPARIGDRGAGFLEDVAWVSKRGLSAQARRNLLRKAASGTAPDLAWLRKTTLNDERLEFLAANPATNWKSFMKVSEETSDMFPSKLADRGTTRRDYADAAGKMRGVSAEVVVYEMTLPGGARIIGSQVKAGSKRIDYKVVDAAGKEGLLEVKGWSARRWKRELDGSQSGQRHEALVHLASQLDAAAATGKPVYLAVTDKLGPLRPRLIKYLEGIGHDAVKLIEFSDDKVISLGKELRTALALTSAGALLTLNDADATDEKSRDE